MPIITNGRLRDYEYMANQNVGDLYPGMFGWLTDPNKIMITMINRLAWLIKKMERTPTDNTASAAKWYLDHIDGHVPLPRGHAAFTTPYIERLRRAIEAHETRVGYQMSPDYFGRMAGDDETRIRWVMYGRPITVTSPATMPPMATPEGWLAWEISVYCWRSGINN